MSVTSGRYVNKYGSEVDTKKCHLVINVRFMPAHYLRLVCASNQPDQNLIIFLSNYPSSAVSFTLHREYQVVYPETYPAE